MDFVKSFYMELLKALKGYIQFLVDVKMVQNEPNVMNILLGMLHKEHDFQNALLAIIELSKVCRG